MLQCMFLINIEFEHFSYKYLSFITLIPLFFKGFFMWTIFKVFVTILLIFSKFFLATRHVGSSASSPGIQPTLPSLEGKVLTTGPPGKSLIYFYISRIVYYSENLEKNAMSNNNLCLVRTIKFNNVNSDSTEYCAFVEQANYDALLETGFLWINLCRKKSGGTRLGENV